MKFKRLIILFCFLALSTFCLAADGLEGDAFYAKGQYKEAIASYQSVINGGQQSAALFYNLGNAYFKSGELPSAILYFEKARLLSPGDEDINHNIRFASTRTVDKIEEAPQFFLTKWWNGIVLRFSVDNWAIIAVVTLITASILLITYFFSLKPAIKKVSFFLAIAFL
ncbi:tetratricopeptide repeat protein [Mucilaginibacter antarcticus]|uniref:tetratricopeptide repeat protein n=1 Tax=Mucilaginibacter antarcticus TaxID=1855725 RepID=UPI003633FEF2